MDARILEKRLTRERTARLEAERLLDTKSAELFEANENLKNIAHRLALQSSQLTAIFENAFMGFFLVDQERAIIRANPYASRIFGYSSKELLGLKLPSIFDLEYIRSVQAIGFERMNLSIQAGEEVYAKTKSGIAIPLECSVSELFLGEHRCTLWIFSDITSRKEREAEKKKMEEELRQAQKLESLGILASGIAHEINTPVQFIGDNLNFLAEAFTELFASKPLAPQNVISAKVMDTEKAESLLPTEEDIDFFTTEVPEAISQSIEGVSRIAEIVAAVREFSHPGTKDKTPLDINKAIESTITISTNQWKYVADIESNFDQEVPAIVCIPGQFNQVILNLITNASQAIEDQGHEEKGLIKISTRSLGDEVEISVEDSGSGIPEEIQSKIFDPFFTTKEVGKGTGQGLSLVHNIVVQKHGGNITFESKKGVGTRFSIRWPICSTDTVKNAA